MKQQTYTLEQIKKAFWEEFHESGELWFDYLGHEEENTECTNSYWDSFVETLEKE
jgi:hypothetical protein